MRIKLTPKTNKGKELVRRLGDDWMTQMTSPCTVQALDNDLGILITPTPERVSSPNNSRWIRWTNDVNFDWSPVQ